MIRDSFSYQNILQDRSQAVVNPVNCVGVSGKGLALQFKKAWPENFERYRAACLNGLVKPGKLFIFETGHFMPPRFIINFPTKRHWSEFSRIEDIELGLTALAEAIDKLEISSIAIPPLGCGLGGLNWAEVKTLIISSLEDLDVLITIYNP